MPLRNPPISSFHLCKPWIHKDMCMGFQVNFIDYLPIYEDYIYNWTSEIGTTSEQMTKDPFSKCPLFGSLTVSTDYFLNVNARLAMHKLTTLPTRSLSMQAFSLKCFTIYENGAWIAHAVYFRTKDVRISLTSLIIKICHSYQATMLVAVLSSANNAWKRRNSHISIIKYTSLIMKKHLAYVRDPLQNELIFALVNSTERIRKLVLVVNTFK